MYHINGIGLDCRELLEYSAERFPKVTDIMLKMHSIFRKTCV